MEPPSSFPSRGLFLGSLNASFFTTRRPFAQQLALPSAREEEPFYPRELPLHKDNDLVKVSDNLTLAVGEITHLSGRRLDANVCPIHTATVEIWQCDAHKVYHHASDRSQGPYKNFQGFGSSTTGSTGKYRFRTIKPFPQPGRPRISISR
jgi:protocatechuate 3,4-dioxygenase beta subunit